MVGSLLVVDKRHRPQQSINIEKENKSTGNINIQKLQSPQACIG